jgi:hypothetical protein
MPSDTAVVKCEVCGEKKRLSAPCGNCAIRERKKRKEEEENRRFENKAKQNCCYCGEPAGKVYRKTYLQEYKGRYGISHRPLYSPELTGGSDVIVVSKYYPTDVEGNGCPPRYIIAHRECHRDHLLAEAEELKKRALKMDVGVVGDE